MVRNRIAAVMLGCALAVLIGSWVFAGTSTTDEVSSIVAAIVALLSALFWVLQNSLPSMTKTARVDQLDLAVRELAEAVVEQLEDEVRLQGLRDTVPATIRWDLSGRGRRGPAVPAVRRPPDAEAVEPLSDYERAILDLYLSSPTGRRRFVVVGAPASGKSVLGLFLALAMLRSRSPSDAVPVVLRLSGWSPASESFGSWVVRTLGDHYTFLKNTPIYGSNVILRLIRTKRLAFVLDGLDEVGERDRGTVVEQIHSFLPKAASLVLTCRADDYGPAVEKRLRVMNATEVVLRPLAVEDAIDFLSDTDDGYEAPPSAVEPNPRLGWGGLFRIYRVSPSVSGGADAGELGARGLPTRSEKWQSLFRLLEQPGPSPVKEVMTVPLYLSLVRSKYGDDESGPTDFVHDVGHLDESGIKTFLIENLLAKLDADADADADAAPHGSGSRANPTRRWLRLVAADGKPRFEWWRVYEFVPATWWSVVAGVLAGLVYLLTSGFPEGLKRGITVGLVLAMTIGLTRGALGGVRCGVLAGVTTGLSVLAGALTLLRPLDAFFVAAELGVAMGVAIAVARSIERSNAAVLKSSLVAGVITAFVTAAHEWTVKDAHAGLVRGLTTTLGIGLSVFIAGVLVRRFEVARPTRQPVPLDVATARRERRLLPYLALGVASGLGIGLGGALIGALRYGAVGGLKSGLEYGAVIGLVYGLTAGLAVGLAGGYVRWMSEPTPKPVASTPVSTLRSARTVAMTYLVLPTVASAIVMWAFHLAAARLGVSGLLAEYAANVSWQSGAALGGCIGLVFAFCFSPWCAYILASALLCAAKRSPLRLIACLERAKNLEILRQDGAAYRFRHDEIGQSLAREHRSASAINP
ncbi:NACHT domain-containing protein [Actinosynnema sp. NPDC004786]